MKTIQLTDEQYNALKNGESITIEPPKKGPWKPEKGQKYFYIESTRSVTATTYHSDSIDDRRLACGNAFSSKENALKASKAMRTHNKILQYIIENDGDWEADWSNPNQMKWYPVFDHLANGWKRGYIMFSQTVAALHCSEQCCEELVELLNNGWLEEEEKNT
jgi:glucan-binding YG repeat protein